MRVLKIAYWVMSVIALIMAFTAVRYVPLDVYDWDSWWLFTLAILLTDMAWRTQRKAWADDSLPVCYWCEGVMRAKDLCVTRYGKTAHYGCYLEERKGWALCEDNPTL